MSWRLRRETAGSGALGDICSHAIDQIQYLTGETVLEASGVLKTFVTQRPGPDGLEDVTVDDGAVGDLLAHRGHRRLRRSVAGGDRAKEQPADRDLRHGGSTILFDLENPNELNFLDATLPVREQGLRPILVNEPGHPYLEAWWPQGHVIGWDHTFTHQIRDFLTAIGASEAPSPSFEEGLQVQRVLAAVEEGPDRVLGLFSFDFLWDAPDRREPLDPSTISSHELFGEPHDDFRLFPVYLDEVQRGFEVRCWRQGYDLMIGGRSSDAVKSLGREFR